jgi:hypothetical protein
LRSSLPPLPDKTLKLTTNHRDPAFIEDRKKKLEIFITEMIRIPHVSNMTCVKSFLGLMDQVSADYFVVHSSRIYPYPYGTITHIRAYDTDGWVKGVRDLSV